MVTNKWFIINEKEKTFKSKRKAKTEAEAWDKTLWKWGLMCDGYNHNDEHETCGLCNIFYPKCTLCPASYKNIDIGCIDAYFYDDLNSDLQYLWLLFVREASR